MTAIRSFLRGLRDAWLAIRFARATAAAHRQATTVETTAAEPTPRAHRAHVVIVDETHVMDNAAMSRLADAIAGRLPQRVPVVPFPVDETEVRHDIEDVITAAIRMTRDAAERGIR